jgi:hypothetical protein
MTDPQRGIEQRANAVFECGTALDLAADVADEATKTVQAIDPVGRHRGA